MKSSSMKLIGILKRKRKAVSILILTASLALSAYLIFAPAKKNVHQNALAQIATSSESQGTDPSLTFQPSQQENLTLNFANQTFNNAVNNDLYQKNGSASIIPPNQSDIQNTISQIIDQEYATPVLKSSDVTVGTDDSKNAQRIYVLYVNQVMSSLPTLTSDTSSAQTQESLESLFLSSAKNLDTAAQLLEAIKVPPSWVQIHKNLLSLLIHQRNIFESLSKAGSDPLRFMIALYQTSPTEFDSAFQEIKNEINQKITNEGLI